MANIILPELGEGIEKATVACWHFKTGDQVAADDDLLEVVTDKATFNVPSDVAGTIQKICVKEGEEAKVGDCLAFIE
jgi:pyruvate/2-oxoglutarate dehydrogenase complex dihydrolipoamide acyltransferase (E2) component